LLASVEIDEPRTTFVDVGSGMGRVVLMAARRPFKQVVGVEISPALHEVARENLAAFDPALRRCRDVRLVRADAAAYRFPAGNLAVYLYNPFRANVLKAVLDSLGAGRARSAVTLLYHTPVERDAIERLGTYELVADLGFGATYRLKR
jgi:SAM-dependent methyltransferase